MLERKNKELSVEEEEALKNMSLEEVVTEFIVFYPWNFCVFDVRQSKVNGLHLGVSSSPYELFFFIGTWETPRITKNAGITVLLRTQMSKNEENQE